MMGWDVTGDGSRACQWIVVAQSMEGDKCRKNPLFIYIFGGSSLTPPSKPGASPLSGGTDER